MGRSQRRAKTLGLIRINSDISITTYKHPQMDIDQCISGFIPFLFLLYKAFELDNKRISSIRSLTMDVCIIECMRSCIYENHIRKSYSDIIYHFIAKFNDIFAYISTFTFIVSFKRICLHSFWFCNRKNKWSYIFLNNSSACNKKWILESPKRRRLWNSIFLEIVYF